MTWLLDYHRSNTFWSWRAEMFTNEQLSNIIKLGKQLESKDGEAVGAPTARSSRVSWLHPGPETNWIYETLTWNINAVNKDKFNYALSHIEPLQFTEYDSNYQGFYSKHLDMGNGAGGSRKLSFVLQLSDPNEYQGGELKLHCSNEPTILPKDKGKLLFFPSWVLHEVTPVTQGTRHSLVGWIAGPAFK